MAPGTVGAARRPPRALRAAPLPRPGLGRLQRARRRLADLRQRAAAQGPGHVRTRRPAPGRRRAGAPLRPRGGRHRPAALPVGRPDAEDPRAARRGRARRDGRRAAAAGHCVRRPPGRAAAGRRRRARRRAARDLPALRSLRRRVPLRGQADARLHVPQRGAGGRSGDPLLLRGAVARACGHRLARALSPAPGRARRSAPRAAGPCRRARAHRRGRPRHPRCGHVRLDRAAAAQPGRAPAPEPAARAQLLGQRRPAHVPAPRRPDARPRDRPGHHRVGAGRRRALAERARLPDPGRRRARVLGVAVAGAGGPGRRVARAAAPQPGGRVRDCPRVGRDDAAAGHRPRCPRWPDGARRRPPHADLALDRVAGLLRRLGGRGQAPGRCAGRHGAPAARAPHAADLRAPAGRLPDGDDRRGRGRRRPRARVRPRRPVRRRRVDPAGPRRRESEPDHRGAGRPHRRRAGGRRGERAALDRDDARPHRLRRGRLQPGLVERQPIGLHDRRAVGRPRGAFDRHRTRRLPGRSAAGWRSPTARSTCSRPQAGRAGARCATACCCATPSSGH